MKKISILLLLIYQSNILAETISIKGDTWCPFNCSLKDKNKGYMIDVARIIFERAGHNIDYQVDTWTKSIEEVRSGKTAAIVAANVYDAPDFIFPKNNLGFSRDCFFVKQKDNWEYKSSDNLKNRKLGVVESYAYSRSVNDFIKNSPSQIVKVNGVDALNLLHQKIQSDQINTIVENPIVFNYYIDNYIKDTKYEEAGCAEGSDLYIAFSPNRPRSKEFSKILSDGIEELRKDGTLDKIITKYSLKEWR